MNKSPVSVLTLTIWLSWSLRSFRTTLTPNEELCMIPVLVPVDISLYLSPLSNLILLRSLHSLRRRKSGFSVSRNLTLFRAASLAQRQSASLLSWWSRVRSPQGALNFSFIYERNIVERKQAFYNILNLHSCC